MQNPQSALFTAASSHYHSPPQPLPATLQALGGASTASSTSTSAPKKIHRNRASYSCHSCRRRKIKCDRAHPTCGNCLKTGEGCKYSDNTGKGSQGGARNSVSLQSNSNKAVSKERTPEQDTTSFVPDVSSGPKRRRTISSAGGYTDDESSAASDYMLSGGNSLQFSPSSTPTTPGITGQHLSSSLRSLVKDGELETRVNRLADIVDQWYRDAYVRGLTIRESGDDVANPTPQISQQRPAIVRQNSSDSRNFSDGSASPQLPRGMSEARKVGRNFQHPQAVTPSATSREVNGPGSATWNSVNCSPLQQAQKDCSVDDIAIGHLSVAEGGRSRYVGNSFWALLSNEITELNNVLRPSDLPGAKKLEKLAGAISTGSSSRATSGWASNGLTTPSPSSSGVSSVPSPDASGATSDYKRATPSTPVVHKSMLLSYETDDVQDAEKPDLTALLQYLPSQAASEALYQSFLIGVQPITPLIHTPSFERQWRTFWAWYPENTHMNPSDELVRDPTFIALLLAILYSGTMAMPAKQIRPLFEGRSKDVVAMHLYNATILAIYTNSFPKVPTVNTLTAFLILQTCHIRMEEPLTSCQYISTAMRVAMSMGFHRDGSLFGLNEVECEVRRRIWWHIIYLDVQVAIATGLPPSGGNEDELFDTKMVSELKDEYIGVRDGSGFSSPRTGTTTPTGLVGSPHSNPCTELSRSKISTGMILSVGRFEACMVIRRILMRLHGIKTPRKEDISEMSEMVYDLKARMEKRIARIPARGLPEMGFIPPAGGDSDDGGIESPEDREIERNGHFNAWARIMLSLLSDRAYGALYEPFLKSTKSKLWVHARQCALRSSHSFLRKFIQLSRSNVFQPYQWYYRTYQPLHATMLLLLDLYERPHAPEAARSRVFVDEVFALFVDFDKHWTGEDGEICPRPVADGAREAWKMLGRLRQRSYLRAGLEVENVFADKPSLIKEEREAGARIWSGDMSSGFTGIQSHQHVPQHHGFTTLPPSFTHLEHEMDATMGSLDHDTSGIESIRAFSNLAHVASPAFQMSSPQFQPEPMMVDTTCHGVGMETMGMGRDEFDWEEWDSVFGKYVSVDVEEGISPGDTWIPFDH